MSALLHVIASKGVTVLSSATAAVGTLAVAVETPEARLQHRRPALASAPEARQPLTAAVDTLVAAVKKRAG